MNERAGAAELATGPNSHDALSRRVHAGTLTWRGPALMLFARAAWGVAAQALVAGVFAPAVVAESVA